MKQAMLFLMFVWMFVKAEVSHTIMPPALEPSIRLNSSDTSKPILFYISGDGGWNPFSLSLMQQFNKEGFAVIGLNAKEYFWTRKMPEQAAREVGAMLQQYLKAWHRKSIIMAGYSFGADVAPFIQARLNAGVSGAVTHTLLLSPSGKTDFEVHYLEMMGWDLNKGWPVITEINKLLSTVVLVFGSQENTSLVKSVTLKKVQTILLPGGHHYEENTQLVADKIIAALR